jgi:hypothetical protein
MSRPPVRPLLWQDHASARGGSDMIVGTQWAFSPMPSSFNPSSCLRSLQLHGSRPPNWRPYTTPEQAITVRSQPDRKYVFFKIQTWDSMFTFPLVHILVELHDTSDYIADAIFLTTDTDGPTVIVCSDLVILLAFA